ncbi:carbohydrate ABC transporter permease [Paenibacillus sp. GCM10012303]|uniref:carbohydrate ABC transporter permease n=1 Tax=Paenibacillus sp. GCM10012303 TaxID=3317340 RepID=UPI003618875D
MRRNKMLRDMSLQAFFVGPATLAFAVIVLLPFLMSIYYSFTEWNGVSSDMKWVGIANYTTILTEDDSFLHSFGFTVRFTVASVVLTNVLGFLLALLLTQALKMRNVLRTIFFMPNVIGGLLLGFIWQFIFVKGFATIGEMTGIGFFQLPWLGDAATGFWGLIIVSVWQSAGYLMIIYIAALSNVPKDVTEAARIDGATRLQMLRHITVPLIMPAVTVCLFLAISWAFKMFDLNMSLTKGGPFGSTESIAMNIYQDAFRNNQLGLGSAKSVIFFAAVALVTLLQVSFTKKREVEA